MILYPDDGRLVNASKPRASGDDPQAILDLGMEDV